MASEVGYLILKVVGCAVLGWLGMRSLRAWWAGRSRQASLAAREAAGDCPAGEVARRGALWAVGEGFVVQMANPKAAVLLLGLYSQFVPDHQSMFAATAVLGAFQVLVETVLYSALVLGVARAGHLFRSSAVARRIEAMVGTVLLGLGVRLALSQRPA